MVRQQVSRLQGRGFTDHFPSSAMPEVTHYLQRAVLRLRCPGNCDAWPSDPATFRRANPPHLAKEIWWALLWLLIDPLGAFIPETGVKCYPSLGKGTAFPRVHLLFLWNKKPGL